MDPNNVWQRAKRCPIQASPEIAGNFDLGFDPKIPPETQRELRRFVAWVEQNFSIPITIWVDFEYRHYLKDRSGRKVGYLFSWSDFADYPHFNDPAAIPAIRLPVRTEHSTMPEILHSFVEALTDYFAWLCNDLTEAAVPPEKDVQEILAAYQS